MEKRLYQRVLVGLISNFIVQNNQPGFREFTGIIDDLSENGIKISVSDSNYSHIVEKLKVGDKISFQTLDEYEIYGELRTDIFSGDAEVIRIDNDGADIIIGCKVYKSSKEFDEYVKNKKMALFMKHGCRLI